MAQGNNIDIEKSVINRLHGDKVIWIIVFLLSLISIALIYSSSSSLAFKSGVTNFSFLKNQVVFVCMGLVILLACYKIPLFIYRKFTYVIFGFSVLLLALTPIIGIELNGAKRWLQIGSFTFQPAELVKVTLILYLAKAIEVFKFDTFKEFFTMIVLPLGFVCVLIMISSVSTTIVIGALSFMILYLAGIRWAYLLRAMVIGAGTLVVLILFNLLLIKVADVDLFPRFSTAISRIENFFVEEELDEKASAEDKQKKADETFQADMASIAVASGKLIGKGPGNSTQRYVLPHPYSDFIYATIVEEYGLVGGVFVLMLYMWLFYRCVMLVKSCTRVFTAITVGGLGLMITTQAGLHILVNTGILPVTGHTLPLISLGGTSFFIFSAAFGIILSVSRAIDIDAAQQAEKRRIEEQQQKKELEERAKAAREEALAREAEEALKRERQIAETEAEALKRRGYGRGEEVVLHEIIDKKTGEFK